MAVEQGLKVDIVPEFQSNSKSNLDSESNFRSNFSVRFADLVERLGQIPATDLEPLASEIQDLVDSLGKTTQLGVYPTSPTIVNLRSLSKAALDADRDKIGLTDAAMAAGEALESRLRSLTI